jgi:hypothetical protein
MGLSKMDMRGRTKRVTRQTNGMAQSFSKIITKLPAKARKSEMRMICGLDSIWQVSLASKKLTS